MPLQDADYFLVGLAIVMMELCTAESGPFLCRIAAVRLIERGV
jgi:hypothetical protein